MKRLLCTAAVMACLTGSALAGEPSNDAYQFILAKAAAAEGRIDDALSLMARVVASDPSNPVLLFEDATLLAEAGRLERAEADLRKAVSLKPDFYDAQRMLGRMLLDRAGNDRGRVEEALDHLRAAWRLNGDDLQTGMTLAQIYLSLGRTDDAEKTVAQLLERAPDQRAINFMYAQILTKLGRGDESKRYLEHATLLDPAFAPAVMQLADIYQKQNDWAKAAEVLQPLIDEEPLNLDLQRQQGFFLLRAGEPEKARKVFKSIADGDPKDARARFYLAEALSDLDQQEEAQKLYRSLLEQTPDDPELLLSYAMSLSAQRKFDEASRNLQILLGVKNLPANLQVVGKTQLAYIEIERGNYDTALAMVKPILVFNDIPNTQAINIGLTAFRKQKKYNEALAFLQPVEEKFGSDAFVSARYLEMLVLAGDVKKAQETAQTQLKFGTRNAIAAAEAYIQAGDAKSAVALVKQAAAAKPGELDLQFALGSAFERSGDIPSAETEFLAILDKHPDHAPTLNYLGYMWAERGKNLDSAAEMLKKAVASEPRNGAYIDSLGWVYFQQGKLELAEKYLRSATAMLPRDATVQEHLGDVLSRKGDKASALSIYRAALKLEPEAKDEAKLRSKIAELERQGQHAQR